jgi:hypothetical protein
MIRNPLPVSAFDYPGAGYPMEIATIPFPIARGPRISIAMRWRVFDPRRRRRRIARDVGRRDKPGREQGNGNKECR